MDFRYGRPPPPPPPSSDPHQRPPQQPVPPPPGTWYPGQFQYHSPSPPPPQWTAQPQHSDHHLPPPPPPPYAVAPPPPMSYSANPYHLPPRPYMPPLPPQPHYPPVNQEWNNSNWTHQGWDYSAHDNNEDVLAARAKAWASKAVTDDQHQHSQLIPASRPEETNYQDQYTQNLNPPYTEFQQHSHPPSSYQQYSSFPPPPRTPANHLQEPSSFTSGYASDGNFSYTARDGNLRDPAAAFPHQEPAPTSVSVHQQEVPSSYSSVAGKEESRETNGKFYQPSHMPFASAPQHQIQPPISIEQPHYSFSNQTTSDLSNQPLDFVPRFSHDHNDSTGPVSTGMHPMPSFGRMAGSSFQPTMPSGNTTFPIGASNAFHATSGFPVDTYGPTPGFPDRQKKASVPNWLREEIIKKTVIGSSGLEVSRQDTESNEDEVTDRSQVDGKGIESTEEQDDDDEDYVEAARTAAINQEIKRILTEVLLKVTDELFDEIATKVLEEDELTVEVEHKPIASSDMIPAISTPKSSAKVLIPTKTKGTDVDDTSRNSNSSSPGDVLGLGNYASDDDDDEEKEVQNSSIPSSINGKPTENGSSQVDGNKSLEKESGVSLNGNLQSKSSSQKDHVTQEHRNVDSGDDKLSDGKHELLVEGVSAKNPLPDDSQGKNTDKSGDKRRSSSKDENEEAEKAHTKVVENNNRIEDERQAKKVKKEDRNGSKDKIKDQDSGNKNKGEKKEIDHRRSYGKEDGRKQEKRKDERSSSRSRHNKRHHSPSPGGGGRGRSSKENSSVSHHAYASSDTSSDDSRRKMHSKRRNISPSPVRSRRQVSRSPPSKRSQHRHYKYSSVEATRERKRSISRSRRG